MTAPSAQGLVTDLYQLTMLQAYLEHGMHAPATFELFTRRLPPNRNYLIAAGLDAALDYLEQLRFEDADIEYLKSLGNFSAECLDYLRGFRFSGSVDALPEGTPFFANEPLLTVHAPLPEAQLVETRLLNLVQLPTAVASKAARVVAAADGRSIIDFGLRHAHGAEAGLAASRAAYIAGVQATSNVAAGQAFGIPVAGTMAHSFVQAHDSEREAFAHFAATFPGATMLVDTYDTEAGVEQVLELVHAAGDAAAPAAVRLDSGDLGEHARRTRRQLDAAGLAQVQIIASGNLDEHEIARLIADGAPIDSFGVGAALAVSEDAPCLDVVYKLVAYDGQGRMKLAAEKSTLPDPKQGFRQFDGDSATHDVLGLANETDDGQPLLEPVMRDGKRLPNGRRSLDDIRVHAQRALSTLPARLRSLELATPHYRVEITPALQETTARTRRRLESQ